MTEHAPFVFISHSSADAGIAMEVVSLLEARGIPCWVAPRDIPPGATYASSIMEAVRACGAMLLLYSEHTAASGHVENEIETAFNEQKVIIPVKLGTSDFSTTLLYYLKKMNWVEVPRDHPRKKQLEYIVEAVSKASWKGGTSRVSPAPAVQSDSRPPTGSRRGRVMAAMAAGVVAVIAIGGLRFSRKQGPPVPPVPSPFASPLPAPRQGAGELTLKAIRSYASLDRWRETETVQDLLNQAVIENEPGAYLWQHLFKKHGLCGYMRAPVDSGPLFAEAMERIADTTDPFLEYTRWKAGRTTPWRPTDEEVVRLETWAGEGVDGAFLDLALVGKAEPRHRARILRLLHGEALSPPSSIVYRKFVGDPEAGAFSVEWEERLIFRLEREASVWL